MSRTQSRSARIGLLAILALLASFVMASPVAAQAETSDVTIHKFDGSNDAPIEGACFEFYEGDATEPAYGPLCTNAEGNALFEDVEHGEYTLHESTVPPGYAPFPDEPVTVGGTTMTVSLRNQPTTITVNKFDGQTGDPLADACFIVTNAERGGTFTSDEQCTDETGTTVFTHIEFGDYDVFETSAPPGYMFDEQPWAVTVSAEEPDAFVDVPNNPEEEPQGGFLFLQKLNCQGVDEAEIRMFEPEEPGEDIDLVHQYPGFQTCAFGEGIFEITGGGLAAPIVLHTDVFGGADTQLDPGTYQIRETSPNRAGPVEFVVEEGDFWGVLALNPMPAGQTPNVPAKPAVEVVPNTADEDVPGTPLAITMLALVGLSVMGMTVRNVADRRRR